MATRLIRRGSRLLAAASSFPPLAAATVLPECVRLCQVTPAVVLPRASLHTSPLCRLADTLPKATSQDPIPQGEAEFFTLVVGTPELKDLLNIPSQHQINGNKGALLIQQIANVQVQDKQQVLGDKRFKELLAVVNSQIQYVWNGRLIRLLKSLYRLGLDSDNRYVQSVEVEVQWRLRKLSIRNLAQLASIIAPQGQSKEERKVLVNSLVKQVELRWTEITQPISLVVLISRLGHMSNALMERLEDKVLEFAENLTPDESRRVIQSLASQNRRTLSVLQALSFHLTQHKDPLAPSLLLDLAYSCAQLNFCHLQVLQRMAADILPKLPELSSTEITRLIRSLSSLRFSSLTLYEAIAQTCLERSSSFSAPQLIAVLHSFAFMNFLPGQSEEFFNMVHQRLGEELDSLNKPLLLDAVWSLCVLSQAAAPYFQKVLEPQFYNTFLEESAPKSIARGLKLLHINSAAQLECPDYQGPLLPADVLQTLLNRTALKSPSSLQKSVRDVMMAAFPEAGTCDCNVQTVYGWHLDCELILDSENKALPLKDFVSPHCLQSEGTQPLPEGARRFAVVCWDFRNFSYRTKELLGQSAMMRRHLRAAGFLVVEVPYCDWQDLKSEWQKQSFLKDQLKKTEAEEMAR